MTTDIIALCAAIDAGEGVLPMLADALEEAGDSRRAQGLRRIGASSPQWAAGELAWSRPARSRKEKPQGTWQLPWSIFNRLKGGFLSIVCVGDARWRYYPTRSAAFLALAEALTQECP